jgi:uncharacterized membrane protein
MPSERRRVAMCALAGLVVALAAAPFVIWELAVLVGWIVTSSTLLIRIWREVGHLDADATRSVSTREDNSRSAARVAVVLSSVASLVAVVVALHRSSRVPLATEVALTTTAMLTVVLSWLVVHTVFVLRYAHLYYGTAPVGGIDFPGGDPPSYDDFAYLGFTVGMTFQVSDTGITSPVIRSTVLRQALLSYLFGTAIIASTINVIAGIIG